MTSVINSPDTASSSPSLETALIGKRAKWCHVRTYYYDPQLKPALKRDIANLSKLAHGWDGYNAPPINEGIIKAASTFIDRLSEGVSPKPRVVPTASGGLQLEWNKGNVSLELEFESPDSIHYLQWNPAKQIEKEDVIPATDVVEGEKLVKWFASQHA